MKRTRGSVRREAVQRAARKKLKEQQQDTEHEVKTDAIRTSITSSGNIEPGLIQSSSLPQRNKPTCDTQDHHDHDRDRDRGKVKTPHMTPSLKTHKSTVPSVVSNPVAAGVRKSKRANQQQQQGGKYSHVSLCDTYVFLTWRAFVLSPVFRASFDNFE